MLLNNEVSCQKTIIDYHLFDLSNKQEQKDGKQIDVLWLINHSDFSILLS